MNRKTNSLRKTNGFTAVGVELARRTTRPASEFVYWFYFFTCVLFLGGLGIWLEFIQQFNSPESKRVWGNVYTSIVTSFPALIGVSCIQMMFESSNRRMQAFSLAVWLITFIVGISLILAVRPTGFWPWFSAICMWFISLWIWWIANADNTRLHDTPPSDAPLGGDPTAPLSGGFGSVKV